MKPSESVAAPFRMIYVRQNMNINIIVVVRETNTQNRVPARRRWKITSRTAVGPINCY